MGGLGRLYLSVFVFVFVCIGVSIFESYKRWEGMEGRLLPGNLWLGFNYVESHLWLTASRTAVHSTYFYISIFLHLDFFLNDFCIFGSLKDSITIDNSHWFGCGCHQGSLRCTLSVYICAYSFNIAQGRLEVLWCVTFLRKGRHQKKNWLFLGNSPKQRTPPTHRYGLGLT